MDIPTEAISINNSNRKTDTTNKVIEAVESYCSKVKEPIKTKTIAFLIGKKMNAISMPMTRAIKSKKIKRIGHGLYVPTDWGRRIFKEVKPQ